MSSYGGVTFEVIDDNGWLPGWSRKVYGSRNKPIGVSRENLQFGGRGNHTITVTVRLRSAADFSTLQGWENDGTARALVDLLEDGVDHASVYLMEVKNIRRFAWQTAIEAECTFERSG